MELQALDLTSAAFKRNPFPTLETMRTMGPVIRTKLPLIGEVWVTSTYEAATDVLREKATFVVDPRNAGRKSYAGLQWWMPRALKALTHNMLGKDDPDHRRLRNLVESAFMQQSIDAMRPRIERVADLCLNTMEELARLGGVGEVDFIEDFARPFPLLIIGELLGIPPKDHDKFAHWGASLTNAGSSAAGLVKAIPAIWKISKYLRRQFAMCREQPRPGMISALVAAEQEGKRLNEQELLATAFLLLIAGHETTVHLLTVGVLSLLQHPEQKRELLSDWSKADTAVDEMLRYNSTVQMTKPRYASKDIELHGQLIRQGEVVVPMLAAANCDPDRFSHPETFDINRSPNAHIAFGTGMHVCLGLKLARAEGGIALEKLLTRFPDLKLAIPEDRLQWHDRLGHRSVRALQLKLGNRSDLASRTPAVNRIATVST